MMTKRISVNNATHADQAKVAVDANAVEAAMAAAHAVTPAAADAELHAGKAPDADVAVKAVADAAHAEAPAVVAAPAELAMVAAGDGAAAVFAAGGQDDTTAAPTADTSYDDGGTDNTAYYVAGGMALAAAAGIALIASDSDEPDNETPTPTPTPTPANEAPEFDAASQDVTVDEDTALIVASAATDADGDDITYTTSDPAHGTVTANDDGTFTYTPDANFEGTDTFTVTASDGTDDATQTINITVEGANDAPAFADTTATATFEENADVATAVYTAEATDPDAGDTITYSLSGADAGAFTIDADTGEIHFAASPDFEAQESYDVTVTATDEAGSSDTLALTVNVTDVDDVTAVNLDEAITDTNLNTPELFDAAGDDFLFQEDANVSSFAEVIGFGEGDTIVVSNADGLTAETTYSFTANETDVIISFTSDSGATNVIHIDDVVTADSGFIFDEASAEAAVGFDFFQYA